MNCSSTSAPSSLTNVEYARIQERVAQILTGRGIDSADLILVIEMIPSSTSAQAPSEPPTEPRPKKSGQSKHSEGAAKADAERS